MSTKRWARRMKRRVRFLAAIVQDPTSPWYVRTLAMLVVMYAASPIDLIPDFVPILGYLDDLILVPLGVYLVIAVTPPSVRFRAARRIVRGTLRVSRRRRVVGAILIAAIWVAAIIWIGLLVVEWARS